MPGRVQTVSWEPFRGVFLRFVGLVKFMNFSLLVQNVYERALVRFHLVNLLCSKNPARLETRTEECECLASL